MLHLGGLIGLATLAFWVYCILDVIATDEAMMRNLPKMAWLLIVIIVPTVGGVAWLLLGRPERTTFAPGSTSYRSAGPVYPAAAPRPLGPDDAPDFLSALDQQREDRLAAWEEDLRRRERELRRGTDEDET